MKKYKSSIETLLRWNTEVGLAKTSHVTFNSQLEWFMSEKHTYIVLKFVYDIGCSCFLCINIVQRQIKSYLNLQFGKVRRGETFSTKIVLLHSPSSNLVPFNFLAVKFLFNTDGSHDQLLLLLPPLLLLGTVYYRKTN